MSKFLNPGNLVYQLGLNKGMLVADFGCGGGFYSIPAAQMVGGNGQVCAIDVIESKLAATQSISRQMGLRNVRVMRADLEKPMTEMNAGECDAVITANILHEVSNLKAVIQNIYRVLKTGGKVLVVEWKKEFTPIGPSVEKRIEEKEMEKTFLGLGFRVFQDLDSSVDTYHYAKVFIK